MDVLIIGAGISGIGVARYLLKTHPARRFQILEARDRIGGTWDLFRYPGIRSDSDLYTFGYEFKPWTNDKSIADAASILAYLDETVNENGIQRHIRYSQRVISANWLSAQGCWEVEIDDVALGTRRKVTCTWLFSAGGYYRYDQGFTPKFEGITRYRGQIIHPQHWPEQLDYSGKRVLVIGSGATAVTLVPAMADKAQHVTMLQRTPTYILSVPAKDPLAHAIRKVLPTDTAHALIRRKNIQFSRGIWHLSQRYPDIVRSIIRARNKQSLPDGYLVDVHFNPPYNPWDQRLCAVPDGDLFRAIGERKASIVTDQIETFTASGVQLKSGRTLDADIIITATGLNIQLFGGIKLYKDGVAIALNESIAYKGMMLSNVPNFAFAIGYTNASWTLKVGLVCEHFCRLLSYMDERGVQVCQPVAPAQIKTRPLLDFGAGYVQRALADMPQQGVSAPWLMSMDYFKDIKLLRKGTVYDRALQFGAAPLASGQVYIAGGT